MALVRREVLAIPHALFSFLQQREGQVGPWWPVARKEASTMALMLGSLYADVGAPLSPTMMATGSGMPAMTASLGAELIPMATRAAELLTIALRRRTLIRLTLTMMAGAISATHAQATRRTTSMAMASLII